MLLWALALPVASDRGKILLFMRKSEADPKSPVYHGQDMGVHSWGEKGQEEAEKYQPLGNLSPLELWEWAFIRNNFLSEANVRDHYNKMKNWKPVFLKKSRIASLSTKKVKKRIIICFKHLKGQILREVRRKG